MSRIEELERRVRQEPASVAFGALAEEYRRAGRLEDAIAACRAGLERHPAYLSARVTLGRALQELQRTGEARAEFEYVLSIAPDNLAAIRGMAELHGEAAAAPAPAPARARVPRPVTTLAPESPAAAPVKADPPAPIERPAQAERPAPIERPAAIERPAPSEPPAPIERPAPPPAVSASVPTPFPPQSDEPDFSAIDASIDAAGGSQRAAQIERLEIWLVRLQELRGGGDSGRDA